ncbi:MAG: DUF4373 domain-containing protein [bacterium]|nr:DUF4373 domain-containing protein [bacterium]
MPKDAFWFKHDANAHNDLKIRALLKRFGWQGYGWFWFLIETLRDGTDYHLPNDDFTIEALAGDMGVDIDEAKRFISYLIKIQLLSVDGDNQLFSKRLSSDMAVKDQRTEVARESALKRWSSYQDKKPDES